MTRPDYPFLLLVLGIAIFAGCTSPREEAESSATSWAAMPKIDVHAHYTYPRDYLVPLLDKWNMRAAVVEIITEDERTRWEPMVAHQRRYPEHLILCTTFDAAKIDEPDFAGNAVAQLREDLERGAKMVKVWKNIGLVYKDATGTFTQIDDPRFQPIWDFLTEEDIPVLAHIGEPRAAWMPLDERSPHYHYYANHPQYHFLGRDDVPAWETVIGARDRWLAANPDLTVIGAHFGSLSYDVDEIAARLDRFPNFYVESAERLGDLVIQPRDTVRDFFVKYHDRILYGTDLGTGTPAEDLSAEELQREQVDYMEQRFRVHWTYLAEADSVEFVRTGTPFRAPTKGLGLPADVLHDVYHRNAERLLDL